MYKFGDIPQVPNGTAFIDIVLSKTQRKTPTVVHPGYKITRVRNFYMRKVKFAQTEFTTILKSMLQSFPRVDDIHPFYGDLMNVLYDRDHFKVALGQLNNVNLVIDKVGKEYVRLMKFADSLYKAKSLKRAAIGRMCTAVKKLDASLKYLEEVRQHLTRLPSITPSARTLLMTGYPNVGKSSFMNLVSNAAVDVQPYAFTTKSLFVGHMDFAYTRWQVIDTPGILDHPLEDRNTIEMIAITALAHLNSTVLFFIDISEQCGYSLEQQVKLFHSIRPLLANKPFLVVLNKIDARPIESLGEQDVALLRSMADGAEFRVLRDGDKVDEKEKLQFVATSCVSRQGVDACRRKACAMLLERRIEDKAQFAKADVLKPRIHVTNNVDAKMVEARPSSLPASVMRKREEHAAAASGADPFAGLSEEMLAKRNALLYGKHKMLEENLGGAGVFAADWRQHHILEDEAWRYDQLPEIMDGRNVADFIDPQIERKLRELEAEEDLLLEQEQLGDTDQVLSNWRETQDKLDEIHSIQRQKQVEARVRKANRAMGSEAFLRRRGMKASKMLEALQEQVLDNEVDTRSFLARARPRSGSFTMDEGDERPEYVQRRSVTGGAAHTTMALPKEELSMAGRPDLVATAELHKREKERKRNKLGKKGEADRSIANLKPKHLFTGKRGVGKTDRR